jgi:hypothetical protein
MDESISKEWKNTHEVLQTSLKQEIGAMREMLANMHQEELSLIAKDRNAWTQVMLERVTILSKLSELRQIRFEATHALESLSVADLNAFQEDCEILTMRDQLTALIEKMNQLHLRILNLETSNTRSSSNPYPPPLPPPKEGPRALLATYPRPK